MQTLSTISISRGDPTLVNRYLADQLGEAERRAFEEQMLADPAVLLRSRRLPGSSRVDQPVRRARWMRCRRRRRATRRYAVAAAVLAALLIGLAVPRWGSGRRAAARRIARSARRLAASPCGSPDPLLLSTRSDTADLVIDLATTPRL